MTTKAVVIFGAGATKACGGPLTNEILPDAFKVRDRIEREGFLDLLDEFLVENFHVPPASESRQVSDFPALSLLLSLLDTAIDRKHPFGSDWRSDRLVEVRDALEYTVFALLEYRLRRLRANHYGRLFKMLYRESQQEPIAISLNYDIIADNALLQISEREFGGEVHFPFYGCDIQTPFYQNQERYFGKLLKLHGSLNWLYCPGCHRLDIGISRSGSRTIKVLDMLYQEHPLEDRYGCHGSPCPDCESFVRPVLITPTHLKDYRNPHVGQVWYQAERALRDAERAIIVGYSLPEDDVDVIYLLKRGLAKIPPDKITVVEYDPANRPLKEHPVGARYRTLFGDDLDWRTEGFGEWLEVHRQLGLSPLSSRLPQA